MRPRSDGMALFAFACVAFVAGWWFLAGVAFVLAIASD